MGSWTLESAAPSPNVTSMRLDLDWKRPLFYVLLPFLVILAFVGFPIPVPPARPTKPSQEQSAPAEKATKR